MGKCCPERHEEIKKHMPHFRKINKETGVPISTQIEMFLKGYIIVKCK